jgi:large subunit ribosomal protein L9
MKIILAEDVVNLGKVCDTVTVARGYARNYLFKTGKAVTASKSNIQLFEEKKEQLQKKAEEVLKEAKIRSKAFEGVKLNIKANISQGKKLYGSIALSDIAQAFKEQGHEVEKNEIYLSQGPIHHIGDYEVMLQLHSQINLAIPLHIMPTESSEKSAQEAKEDFDTAGTFSLDDDDIYNDHEEDMNLRKTEKNQDQDQASQTDQGQNQASDEDK